ncbi:hypothetical protein S40288_06725 [Stachybotrys chartarum IBT 40288]|nr:hypothetical protein S40288_06725 [Stachybotrys chartarum IBT 40288]
MATTVTVADTNLWRSDESTKNEPAPPPRVASVGHRLLDTAQASIELQPIPTERRETGILSDSDLRGQEELPQVSPVPDDDGFEVMPSVWEPYMNRFRLLSVCLANLMGGLADSAAGALIPYMERHYHVGYAVVSLIFVGQALGFITAAAALDSLRARFGRGKVLGLANAILALGYLPIVATAPFPVVVLSFFLVGFGLAINVAISNIFTGSLRNSTILLGLLHGSYGIGGTVGPLIATAIVTVAHAIWSRYYLLTLSLATGCSALALWTFWNYEKEQSPRARELETPNRDVLAAMGLLGALRSRIVVIGAIFIFAYQGAEVSISGWVISFLITARDGDPAAVGYVTAGFWAGITIGRFVLSGPAQRIGEKKFVYGLTVGALIFQLLVWLVPNIVTNAVAVSIVGLMLGPIYPCAAAFFMRRMTKAEALSGMGTISACGSLGGAVAPFFTGLLAQAVGTFVLHPISIGLFLVMLVCWRLLPADSKRKE